MEKFKNFLEAYETMCKEAQKLEAEGYTFHFKNTVVSDIKDEYEREEYLVKPMNEINTTVFGH